MTTPRPARAGGVVPSPVNGTYVSPRKCGLLARTLGDADRNVRREEVRALEFAAFNDEDEAVRQAAAAALKKVRGDTPGGEEEK